MWLLTVWLYPCSHHPDCDLCSRHEHANIYFQPNSDPSTNFNANANNNPYAYSGA